jgi:hypothetical protein
VIVSVFPEQTAKKPNTRGLNETGPLGLDGLGLVPPAAPVVKSANGTPFSILPALKFNDSAAIAWFQWPTRCIAAFLVSFGEFDFVTDLNGRPRLHVLQRTFIRFDGLLDHAHKVTKRNDGRVVLFFQKSIKTRQLHATTVP